MVCLHVLSIDLTSDTLCGYFAYKYRLILLWSQKKIKKMMH